LLGAVQTVRLLLDGLDVLEASERPFVDRREQYRDWRAEVFGVDEVLDGADCGDSSVCRNLRRVTGPSSARRERAPDRLVAASRHAPPVAPDLHFPDRVRLAA
jgi:hypothetical protein